MIIPPLSFGLENMRWVLQHCLLQLKFEGDWGARPCCAINVQEWTSNYLDQGNITQRQSQLRTKPSLSVSSKIWNIIFSLPLLTETSVGSQTSRVTRGSPTSLDFFTLRSRRRWQRWPGLRCRMFHYQRMDNHTSFLWRTMFIGEKNLLCGDFLSWRKMTMRMKKDDDGLEGVWLIRGNRYSGCRVAPPAVIEFRAHPPPAANKLAAKYPPALVFTLSTQRSWQSL